MNRSMSAFDKAVETFKKSSNLSEGEARVFVSREIADYSRAETAEMESKAPSTVDTLLQRAKDKNPRLPSVSKIENGRDDVRIWFENDACLRYHVENGTVYETVYQAHDPNSVWEEFDVAIKPDELHDAALESLAEYINTYQNDIEACRNDWTPVYEALTGFRA